MKHFTKIALAASLIFGIAANSFAQDAGIISIEAPVGGTNLYPNIPTTPSMTLRNFGSTALTSSNTDSVIFFLLAGSPQQIVAQQTLFFSATGVAAGADAPWTFNNGVVDWSSTGLSAGLISVCGKCEIWNGGSMVDINANNDETCQTNTLVSTPFTYDMGIDYARIGTPALDTGTYLSIPTFPTELAYDLVNYSTTTDIFPGVPYVYEIFIAGASASNPITASSNGFISTNGGREPHTVGGTFTLPLTPGSFEICFNVAANSNDLDNSNDSDCGRYYMGNPDGIVENEGLVFGEVYYDGSNLKVSFNDLANGMAKIDLYEVSGRSVANYEVNLDKSKDHSIDASSLSRGIYIVNITVADKVMPYKFSVR